MLFVSVLFTFVASLTLNIQGTEELSMRFQFTFKKMESSPALISIVEGKFNNVLRRFQPQPQRVRVTFAVEGREKRLHVSLVTHDGVDLEAEDLGGNAYQLIDAVLHKLDERLRRLKERRKVRRVNFRNGRSLQALGARGSNFETFDSELYDSAYEPAYWRQPHIEAEDVLGLTIASRAPLGPVTLSQAI